VYLLKITLPFPHGGAKKYCECLWRKKMKRGQGKKEENVIEKGVEHKKDKGKI
jgi:hypothetical protein